MFNKKRKVDTSIFEARAAFVAALVCGSGECISGYPECNDPDQTSRRTFPMSGTDKVCPLKKYNVVPGSIDDRDPTLDELFYVCACCEHSGGVEEVEINGEKMYKIIKDDDTFKKHCADCPIHFFEEYIREAEGEAAYS